MALAAFEKKMRRKNKKTISTTKAALVFLYTCVCVCVYAVYDVTYHL